MKDLLTALGWFTVAFAIWHFWPAQKNKALHECRVAYRSRIESEMASSGARVEDCYRDAIDRVDICIVRLLDGYGREVRRHMLSGCQQPPE